MYFDFARLQILQLRPSKNPVDLFSVKSDFEQLVALLKNLTGLDFVESEGFPRNICKSCYNRVKQSQADQAKLIRFKKEKKRVRKS